MSDHPIALSDDELAHVSGGVGSAGAQHKTVTPDLEALAAIASQRVIDQDGGVPTIDPLKGQFSPQDMADLLRSLQTKAQDTQLAAAKQGLAQAGAAAEKHNEDQALKIDEWIRKCQEAESNGLLGKLYASYGKVAEAYAQSSAQDMPSHDQFTAAILSPLKDSVERNPDMAPEVIKQAQMMFAVFIAQMGAEAIAPTKQAPPVDDAQKAGGKKVAV